MPEAPSQSTEPRECTETVEVLDVAHLYPELAKRSMRENWDIVEEGGEYSFYRADELRLKQQGDYKEGTILPLKGVHLTRDAAATDTGRGNSTNTTKRYGIVGHDGQCRIIPPEYPIAHRYRTRQRHYLKHEL